MGNISKLLFIILFLVVLVSITNSGEQDTIRENKHFKIETGPNYVKSCDRGNCTLSLFSTIRYTYEDNQWKPIEKARSLMNDPHFIWDYIETDKNTMITVKDFNYTSILFDFEIDPKYVGSDVPLYLGPEALTDLKNPPIDSETKQVKLSKDKEEVTMPFSLEKNQYIKFGSNSTTIKLNVSGTDLLIDGFIDQLNPTDIAGTGTTMETVGSNNTNEWLYMQFNISAIPATAEIQSAFVFLMTTANYIDAGEGWYVGTHWIYPQYNLMENETWNSRPEEVTGYNISFDSLSEVTDTWPTAGKWDWYSVRGIIGSALGNNSNVSILFTTNYTYGSPGSLDYITYATREATNVTNRPFLNITYYIDSITIVDPVDEVTTIFNNNNISLNITTEGYNQSIWYNINGYDLNGYKKNTTLCTQCDVFNTTLFFNDLGTRTIYVYGNNSAGNEGYDTVVVNFYNQSTLLAYNDSSMWAKDTWISKKRPSSNYGRNPIMELNNAGETYDGRILYWQNFTANFSYMVIKNATLFLTLNGSTGGTRLMIYPALHYWEEGIGDGITEIGDTNTLTINGSTWMERWYEDNGNNGNNPFNQSDSDWQTNGTNGNGTDFDSNFLDGQIFSNVNIRGGLNITNSVRDYVKMDSNSLNSSYGFVILGSIISANISTRESGLNSYPGTYPPYTEVWYVNDTINITLGINNATNINNTLFYFNFTAVDPDIDTCTLYGNWGPGGSWTANNSVRPVSGNTTFFPPIFPPGTYLWNVQCNQTQGSSATASQNYTISLLDTLVPTLRIISPIIANYTSTSIKVNLSNSSDVEYLWWSNNSDVNRTYVLANYTFSQGYNTIYAYANDSSNNVNRTNITFYVDSIAPSINITEPSNFTYRDNYNYSFMLNISSTDSGIGVSRYWYSLNNGVTNTTFTPNMTLTGLSAGSNNLWVAVNDTLGNENRTSMAFYLDFTPKINIINVSNATTSFSTSLLSTNLVAWYRFEEMSRNIRDYSTSGINGTAAGIVFGDFENSINQFNLNCGGVPATRYVEGRSGLALKLWSTGGDGLACVYKTMPAVETVGDVWYFYGKGFVSAMIYNGTGITRIDDITHECYTPVGTTHAYIECNGAKAYGDWSLFRMTIGRDSVSTPSIYMYKPSAAGAGEANYAMYEYITNGSIWFENGSIGGAQLFDGHDDYLDIPYNLKYDMGTNNITLSAWIRTNVTNTTIVSEQANATEFYKLSLPNEKAEFSFSAGDTVYVASGTTSINDNKWHFIVGVRNGTKQAAIYVDGVLQNSTTGTGTETGIYTTNINMKIGGNGSTSVSNFFNGLIDEVRIYNQSLTADQVMQLYYTKNPIFQEYPNVTITANITDEDTASGSLWYRWLVDGVQKLAGYAQNVFNWIFTGQSQTVVLVVNDTFDHNVTQTWNITQVFVTPTVSFLNPDNSSNITSYVLVNITGVELNRNSSWLAVDSTNYTMTCSGGNTTTFYCFYNVTGLTHGRHIIRAYVNDTVGNLGQSEARVVVSDLQPPSINVSSPLGMAYLDNYSRTLELKVSTYDPDTVFNKSWYTLDNGTTNISFTPNTTITGLALGRNNLIVYVNDTMGNQNMTRVNFNLTFTPKINEVNTSNFTKSYLRTNNSLDQELVGYWKFDENWTMQEDSSPNSSNGTIAASYWNINISIVNGKVGTAVKFDGKNASVSPRISTPVITLLSSANVTESATYNVWINFGHQWQESCCSMALMSVGGNGFIRSVAGAGDISYFDGFYLFASSDITGVRATVQNDQWHMLTSVLEKNPVNETGAEYKIKTYVDGALIGTNAYTRKLLGFAVQHIGANWGANSINGTMDELRLYTRNLSQNEIRNLYYNTNPYFEESANVTLNVSIIDEDSNQDNLYFRWKVNDTDVYAGYNQPSFNFKFNRTLQNASVYINDTNNNVVMQFWDINITYDQPAIRLDYPTNTTYKDIHNRTLSLNVTASDTSGLSTYWYTLDNGLTNYSFIANGSISGAPAGSNHIDVYVNDTLGNENKTDISFYLSYTPMIDKVNASNATTSYYSDLYNRTLVAWYKLDKNSSIQEDSSENSYNATAYNNATFTTSGKIGGAYRFDGLTGYMLATKYLPNSSNFTVMMWLYQATGDQGTLFNHNVQFKIESTGTLRAQYHDGSWQVKNSANAITLGTWNHVAMSFNRTTITFYINGVRDANTYVPASIAGYNPTSHTIGVDGVGGAEIFNGTLDDIRVYNSTLNDTEVYGIYSNMQPTFQEYANVTLIANTTDYDTSQGNLYYEWFVDGVIKLWGYAKNIFNYIYPLRNQIVTVRVNDSFNYDVNASWNISTAFVYPNIIFAYPPNNTNSSDVNLDVNFTALDANLFNCWYSNDTNAVNVTYSNCTTNITTVIWSEGMHNVTVYVNDTVGNVNRSTIRFRIDTTAPTISIVSPGNITYMDYYSRNISLNITTSDLSSISAYWYTLDHGLNNISFTPNITMSGLNITNNILYVYANDTAGNQNIANVSFYLAFTPKVNLINISNATINYYTNQVTTGLVGWWKLDENNTNQIDSSGMSNNGTVTGATFNPSGVVGGAYDFNGTVNYIGSINTAAQQFSNSSFTISFWAKTTNLTQQRDILARTSTGTNGYLIIRQGSLGTYDDRIWAQFYYNATNHCAFSSGDTTKKISNNWQQFVFVVNRGVNNNLSSYLNGNFVNDVNCVGNPFYSSTSPLTFGLGSYSGGYWNGSLDEVRIYNRSLSTAEISQLYQLTRPTFQEYPNVTIIANITDEDTPQTSLWYSWLVDGVQKLVGYGSNIFNWIFTSKSQIVELTVNDSNNYSVVQTWNITTNLEYPLFIFNYQNPSDITTNNTIERALEISYNITDNIGILDSTVLLYYKTNTTLSDTKYYINGTPYSGYYSTSGTNVSSTWNFTLTNSLIYSGTYNYNEPDLEKAPHGKIALTGQNNYLKIELLNVSGSKNYSFFEVMANSTAGAGALRFYYCNSTYSTGNPSTSSVCSQFNSLAATQTFNHLHTTNSSHQIIPMTINTSSSQIGNIQVTSVSYILLRGTTGTWFVYNITNVSRTDAMQSTSNNGASWTSLSSSTIDAHLHQYDGKETFYYYACANDTNGLSNCSSVRSDIFQLAGIPPSSPNVFSPISFRYNNPIIINYTSAESPNGYRISFYNITLVNLSDSYLSTIQTNNTLNLSYTWSTTGTTDGEYKIKVEVCDYLGQCSSGYSDNFTIDNTYPTMIVDSPINTSYKDYYNFTLNLNMTGSDTNGISAYWYSINNGVTNYTFTPNTTVAFLAGSNTLSISMNDTANNENRTKIALYMAFSPQITTMNVSNLTAEYNRNALLTNLIGYWRLDESYGDIAYDYFGLRNATLNPAFFNVEKDPSFENSTWGSSGDCCCAACSCTGGATCSGIDEGGGNNCTCGASTCSFTAHQATDSMSGEFSLNLTGRNACACNAQSFTTWAVNTTYNMGFWYKFASGTSQPRYCMWVSGRNVCDPSINFGTGDTEWHYYSTTFRVKDNTTGLSLFFYGGSTSVISSALYDDVKVTDGPLWIPSGGKYGNGLLLDGANNYVSTPMTFTPNETFSIWVKTTTGGPVMAWSNGPNNGYYDRELRVNTASTTNVSWYVWNKGTIYSNLSVTDGAWHMLTGMADSGSIRLYIDGKLSAITSGNYTSDAISDTTITIGSSTNGYLNGTIDEVRVYNQTLTDTQVWQLYTITNPIFTGTPDANITFTINVTDLDTPQASLYYEWFVNGVLKLYGYAKNIFNWVFSGVSQVVTVKVNDTFNYAVNQTWNVSLTGTCVYSGTGDWVVNCGENCTVNTAVNGNGANFTMTGTGRFNINATIDGFANYHVSGACVVHGSNSKWFR